MFILRQADSLTHCSLFRDKLTSLQQYLLWMCDAHCMPLAPFPPISISSALTLCLHACTHDFQQDTPQLKSKEWNSSLEARSLRYTGNDV